MAFIFTRYAFLMFSRGYLIGNKSDAKNPHILLTVYNGIWIGVSKFPAKHSLINIRGK